MAFFKNLHMIMTTSCKHASSLLSKSQDGPLTLAERLSLRLHLCICRYCRRYRRQLVVLRRLLRTLKDRGMEDRSLTPSLSPSQRREFLKRISIAIQKNL